MRGKWYWMAVALAVAFAAVVGLGNGLRIGQVAAQGQQSQRPRVNAPYVNGSQNIPLSRQAVFWFGQVTPLSNHANVRVGYNDQRLQVTLHIFDQYLWYNRSPAAADLINWDAATLYLNLNGNSGTAPGAQSYRFRAQLSNYQERSPFEAAYRGNGAGWQPSNTPFNTRIEWRGEGLNDLVPDRGWVVVYEIPFSSLGLAGRPAEGTSWGMALAVHDRDDVVGATLEQTWWPTAAGDAQPSTWGRLHFGAPQYAPPFASAGDWVTVRQGLNGAQVPDAHVGGHSNCGDPYGPQYFPGWGSSNYSGYNQVNIQNQWDVADWPCFSRYYVTFPLDQIPPGKVVISATLTLYQFGNSNPQGAEPSRIQVLTVDEDWSETAITWNNAPLAVENIDVRRVDPVPNNQTSWAGVPRTWNVSRAVAQALSANSPLRLALYSADGAYHSGKYFYSSNADEMGQRPVLRVLWGDLFSGEVERNYLPMVTRR